MKKRDSGEIANGECSVIEFQAEVKGGSDTDIPSDCPRCRAVLVRVFLKDLTLGDDGTNWTRRFVDGSSDLAPGRYRCSSCLSEWWRFPASVAS
jgi:hypothetical protein